MSNDTGARLSQFLALADILEIPATAIARELQRRFKPKPRRRGGTLRPGHETTLWLALAAAIEPHLKPRGEKARLARVLGVSPNRIQEFFRTRTAMPDAERTLFLLLWLASRRRGSDRGQ